MTSIDVHGRLSDRSPLQIMGWGPGQPIAITPAAGVITVAHCPDAGEAITRQGHLRLPASVRHALRLQPGDRLLVAARPDIDLLVAYPTSALDQVLLSYHSAHQPEARQ